MHLIPMYRILTNAVVQHSETPINQPRVFIIKECAVCCPRNLPKTVSEFLHSSWSIIIRHVSTTRFNRNPPDPDPRPRPASLGIHQHGYNAVFRRRYSAPRHCCPSGTSSASRCLPGPPPSRTLSHRSGLLPSRSRQPGPPVGQPPTRSRTRRRTPRR